MGLLALGHALPLALPSGGAVAPQTVWIVLLFAYCFVASVTPVQLLLQPRDYLSSFVLFTTIGVGVVGAVIAVAAPMIQRPRSTDSSRAIGPPPGRFGRFSS